MSKDPAFQFYAQDFLTGVIYLTNEEIGIYVKMLCKQWTDEKIPKKRLGFLIGCEWNSVSDELKEKFEDRGDHLINTRLEDERIKRTSFKKKQSENGKKGGRGNKSNSNIKPNKSQKKPLENENDIEDENENVIELEIYPTFEDFWELYDKKTAKPKCISRWNKLSHSVKEKIMNHVVDYKKSQPDKQFRKNPETYLNNESWNDEIIFTNEQGLNGKEPTINRQTADVIKSNSQGWHRRRN